MQLVISGKTCKYVWQERLASSKPSAGGASPHSVTRLIMCSWRDGWHSLAFPTFSFKFAVPTYSLLGRHKPMCSDLDLTGLKLQQS